MFAKLLVAAVVALSVGFAGAADAARVVPIYNVENADVFTGSGENVTLAEVRAAIVAAAKRRKWALRQVGEGHLRAALHVRRHMARVDIKYSGGRYSIIYNDSSELGYDGTRIHRNYNRWIRNLERSINDHLRKH